MAPPLKVDLAHLKVIADNTGSVADSVGRVEHMVSGCEPGPEDILGEFGVVAAYRQFHDLWSAELRTATAAARQLADGLQRAAADYAKSDGYASHRFR
jgi:hypothetical protein